MPTRLLRVEDRYGKPSPVPSQVTLAIQQSDASRNGYLWGLDEYATEVQLRDDLSRFGLIDQFKIVRHKDIGIIHYLSMSVATKVCSIALITWYYCLVSARYSRVRERRLSTLSLGALLGREARQLRQGSMLFCPQVSTSRRASYSSGHSPVSCRLDFPLAHSGSMQLRVSHDPYLSFTPDLGGTNGMNRMNRLGGLNGNQPLNRTIYPAESTPRSPRRTCAMPSGETRCRVSGAYRMNTSQCVHSLSSIV